MEQYVKRYNDNDGATFFNFRVAANFFLNFGGGDNFLTLNFSNSI